MMGLHQHAPQGQHATQGRPQDPAPVYEPFRWVSPEDVEAVLPSEPALRLAGMAQDIAGGAAIIIGMLQRMAIVSLEMLRDAAEDFQDSVARRTRWERTTSQG